ncbi:MAG: Nramp family divalent metal transporter [Chitinophagaceae bacterium]
MLADTYVITERTIKEPPVSFFKKLKFLGPGFILSASIVGSGELIATTTLGARAGFVAFWIIIVSCLVKVAVQLEFGKRAILTGQTAMRSFNELSGPRSGKGNWVVWTVFILISLKIIQIGGILGGTAIVLHMLFPFLPISAWAFFIAVMSSAMIYKGYYSVIEKVSLVMIAGFTIATITAVFMLQFTAFSFSWTDVWEGLQFKLPPAVVAIAFGAFGITGVGADEVVAYNYWCIEKGYAAYTGPRNDSPEWKSRARGWISVMYLDALLAMIIYTIVTAAFYLLGAAVLHDKSIVPEGNEVIETLALIYTQSLGPGAKTVYLVGAFFVLFSSVFASLAAWTRVFPDIFGQMGWINFFDVEQRKKIVSRLAWIIPMIWAITYLFIKLPVFMIISGGIVGSVLLFVIVFAAIQFRNKRKQFLPSGIFYNIIFVISILSIISIGLYGLVQFFSK